MSLISYADLYVAAILNLMFVAIILKKVFKLKILKSTCNKILIIMFFSIFLAAVNLINKDIFKVFMTLPIASLCIKELFDIKLSRATILSIISTIYLLIGEIITTIFVSYLYNKYQFSFYNIIGGTIGCILVIIFSYPFIYIKSFNKILITISEKMNLYEKRTQIISLAYMLFISAAIYKNINCLVDNLTTIMNIVIYALIIFILYLLYKEQKKSQDIADNYNKLLIYLEKYEKEIVEKRKIIHDYKNQLIVINGYIDNKIKLKEYIKEIIEEQKTINDNEMIKNIDKLPSGLKGLVYYKLSQIDNKIVLNIEVSGQTEKFNMLDSKTTEEVLKITGILLDNAIEAVEETSDKYISISLSLQENILKMEILNTSKNKVDIDIIRNPGFSTKGKDRGYGIPLILDILNKNSSFNLIFKSEDGIFISDFDVKI